MNKVALLRVINPILFCLFLIQAVTGLIMVFGLPVPAMPALLEVHEFNGITFIVVIAVHLTLNGTWVRANYFIKRNRE